VIETKLACWGASIMETLNQLPSMGTVKHAVFLVPMHMHIDIEILPVNLAIDFTSGHKSAKQTTNHARPGKLTN
jgi:hypothetical protein